ncbi:hypothetical protein evm_004056 [Chilo suppressalis]|nr:hypothetical protein evm_004056 [Chilo suppressalis]
MSVIDESWDICLNLKMIESDHYLIFAKIQSNHQDAVAKLLDEGFKTHRFVVNGTLNVNNDDELQIVLEKNKHLRCVINNKISELEIQQNKYETFKKDQKLLSQEIKETHEAFLLAKKFYKKYLKMYFTIESRNNAKHTIFIQFFTESKKESENYSVRLQRDIKSGVYELLNTTPKLKMLKEYQRRLQENNDVPELNITYYYHHLYQEYE